METTEIMVNEEIVDTMSDIVLVDSKRGYKVGFIIGGVILGGIVTYRYVLKPIIAKRKNLKNQQNIEESYNDSENDDSITFDVISR